MMRVMTSLSRSWSPTGLRVDAHSVPYSFSLSKWIHINSGDEGLTRFFARVYAVLRSGGFFALEPQSWESYSKPKRMDPVWIPSGNEYPL